MFGPGAYRPDPTEGITALAELPQPEIVPYHRTDTRQACPRCHHWKRNRFMCYYSVAERCSFQSGNSKEGTCWDTSHKPH